MLLLDAQMLDRLIVVSTSHLSQVIHLEGLRLLNYYAASQLDFVH